MIDNRNDGWNDSLSGSTGRDDPAAIEADIRRTQDEMSRTVDQIGDQLTPRSIMNALFDKAESNNIDARMLLDGARRNPLALAMIAGGALWLISDRDANLPKKRESKPTDDGGSLTGQDFSGRSQSRHRDQHDNRLDYVAHMERVEWRDGEDEATYRRRRDIARSNYFMIERGHDEDEASFRRRLDDAANQMREQRSQLADKARHAGSALRSRGAGVADKARAMGSMLKDRGAGAADQARHAGEMMRERGSQLAGQARHLLDEYPAVGGLLAATAGAAIATTIPVTRMESDQLSGVGQRARSLLNEQKDRLVDAARGKKDDLVHRAEDALHQQEPAAS